jgi:peptidoglycan hydrolase-like protein with peptidoglycan-binding domain
VNRQTATQRQAKSTPTELGGVLQSQRQAAQSIESSDVPDIVHEVLRTSGQPLDPATRNFMEPRFSRSFSQLPVHGKSAEAVHAGLTVGPLADHFEAEAERTTERVMHSSQAPMAGQVRHDFSQVKLHTDERAAKSASAVNARAYTVGQHIVFGAGQYQPQLSAGRRLLAHELTHTLQQAAPQGAPTARLQRSSPPTSPSDKMLRKGARGPAVRLLQRKLIALGYLSARFGAPGNFGPETEAAIRRFQKDVGKTPVDGIFGPKTRRLLDEHFSHQENRSKNKPAISTAVPAAAGNNSKAKQDDKSRNHAPTATTMATRKDKSAEGSSDLFVKIEQGLQDTTSMRQLAPVAFRETHKLYGATLIVPGFGYVTTYAYSLFATTTLGPKGVLLVFAKDAVNFGFDGKSISITGVAQGGITIAFSLAIDKSQQLGAKFTLGGASLVYTTKTRSFPFMQDEVPLELQLWLQLEVGIEGVPPLPPRVQVPVYNPVPDPFLIPFLWFAAAKAKDGAAVGADVSAIIDVGATVEEDVSEAATVEEGVTVFDEMFLLFD